MSGAQAGPLGAPLLQGQAERAAEIALQLAGLFPHRFYIELQRAGRPEGKAMEHWLQAEAETAAEEEGLEQEVELEAEGVV